MVELSVSVSALCECLLACVNICEGVRSCRIVKRRIRKTC